MKLTEGKIKEAQEVIEAVMAECGIDSIEFSTLTRESITADKTIYDTFEGDDLATLYITRLYELDNKAHGTNHTPPPF